MDNKIKKKGVDHDSMSQNCYLFVVIAMDRSLLFTIFTTQYILLKENKNFKMAENHNRKYDRDKEFKKRQKISSERKVKN